METGIVAPPRKNLIRYAGIFAPIRYLRQGIVPIQENSPGEKREECKHPTTRKYWAWAKLLARVFEIDILECPRSCKRPDGFESLREDAHNPRSRVLPTFTFTGIDEVLEEERSGTTMQLRRLLAQFSAAALLGLTLFQEKVARRIHKLQVAEKQIK